MEREQIKELVERLRAEASRRELTYGVAAERTREGRAADTLEVLALKVEEAEARAQAAEALLARAGVSLEKLLAMHGTDADLRQAASLLAEIRGTQAAGVEGE